MKNLLIALSFLSISLAGDCQTFSGRTANNCLLMRYTDTTGVVPVIGRRTVAFIFRVADSSLYWWTNVRKTWTLYTTGGTPTLAAVIASSNTISSATTIAAATTNVTGISGTAGFFIPSGTTAQRPTSPQTYTMRFNTDSSGVAAFEYYNGSSWTSFTSTGGGGGGTPGGSTTQYQSNLSGAFSGSAILTTDQTTNTMIHSISGSSAASLLNMTPTWNTTGVPTALKLNVTNTASGTGSALVDFQLGGTSFFKVIKSGVIQFGSSSGGQLDLTNSTTANYLASAATGSRSDFNFGGFFMSTGRSAGTGWTVNSVTSGASEPNTFGHAVWNPVSTTVAQLATVYDGTHYTQFTTNSSGNLTIAPTGGKVALTGYGSGTNTGTSTFNLQVDASGNIIEGSDGGAAYTPTLTNTTNITTSATAGISSYTKSGPIVRATVHVNVTATAATTTTLTVSLPINTTNTTQGNCGFGFVQTAGSMTMTPVYVSITAAGTADIWWAAPVNTIQTLVVSFQYTL